MKAISNGKSPTGPRAVSPTIAPITAAMSIMMLTTASSMTFGRGMSAVSALLPMIASATASTTAWKATPPSRLLTARRALPPTDAVTLVATSGSDVTKPSSTTPITARPRCVRSAISDA